MQCHGSSLSKLLGVNIYIEWTILMGIRSIFQLIVNWNLEWKVRIMEICLNPVKHCLCIKQTLH